MTRTFPCLDDLSVGDSRAPSTGTPSPLGEDLRHTEFPLHRNVIVHVTGGLDGVMRVAMMLRGRRYRVRDLAVDVREGVLVSEVRATIALTISDTDLLLNRLRRLTVVHSADKV
jgi:hypothetical protein